MAQIDAASDARWLQSIDAVYALFEDDRLRAQYPDLAAKVEKAVRLTEEAYRDVGWVAQPRKGLCER